MRGGFRVRFEGAADPADGDRRRESGGVGRGVQRDPGDCCSAGVGDGVGVEGVWIFDGEEGRGQTLERG